MPTKYQFITELYQQTLHKATGSYEAWTGFLRAASYNYKCPFDEQILIYAQRPDATAVLELERWNRQFGRWVNRGASGIAVFDDVQGRERLKYYFDVADTHASQRSRPVPIWEMDEWYEDKVIETLENTFGALAEKETLADAILSASHNAVADNLPDYLRDLQTCREGSFLEELDALNVEVEYRQTLESSIAYMLMSRLSIDANFYLTSDDFSHVYDFNTPDTINALGIAASDIAEMGLREVARTVLALQKEQFFANDGKVPYDTAKEETHSDAERSEQHGDDLHGEERLSDSRPADAPAVRGPSRQVRGAAAAIPDEAPAGAVHEPENELPPDGASGRDRDAGPEDGGADRGADGAGRGRDRGAESPRPDAMDGSDEQLQAQRGGTGAERPNLFVNIESKEAGSDALPAFLDAHLMEAIVLDEGGRRVKRQEIFNYFQTHKDSAQRVDFLENAYTDTFVEILVEGVRVGYHKQDDGLLMWEGSFLSRTSESVFSWGVVTEMTENLVERGEYKIKLSLQNAPVMSEQLTMFDMGGAMPVYEIGEVQPPLFSSGEVPQAVIDKALYTAGSEFGSAYRVAAFYVRERPEEENTAFLRREFDIENGRGIEHEGRKYAVWFTEDGIQVVQGNSVRNGYGRTLMTWEQASSRILELLNDGIYLSPAELPQAYDKAMDYMADALLMTARELTEEARTTGLFAQTLAIHDRPKGYPDLEKEVVAFANSEGGLATLAQEYHAFLEAYANDRSITRFRVSEYNTHRIGILLDGLSYPERRFTAQPDFLRQCKMFITQDEIDRFFLSGGAESNLSVYSHFCYPHTPEERQKFIKSFYGEYSGGSCDGYDHTKTRKGLTYKRDYGRKTYDEVTLTIPNVVKQYERLIAQKRFPGAEALAKIPEYEVHQLARSVYNGFYNAPQEIPRPYLDGADFYTAVPAIEAQLSDPAKVREMLEALTGVLDATNEDDRYFDLRKTAKEQLTVYLDGRFSLFNHRHDALQLQPEIESDFVRQVEADVAAIVANEPERYERFSVIDTDEGYAVWDDIRDEIYVDEDGVSADFDSEWQAETYLEQLKKAVADKEATEWLYVEQTKAEPSEVISEQVEEQPVEPETQPLPSPAPRKKDRTPAFAPLDPHGVDYVITNDALGAGTPSERYANNVTAIRLLHELESEGRTAVSIEKAALARYVGWGGLADCFDPKDSRYGELKALLDEGEYASARESTLTAFYTPPVVISAMYQGLSNLGFTGGNLIDPGCGVGHIFGRLPDTMSASKLYGVELDSISGRIARQLYPTAGIAVQGYEKTDFPDNFFDVAIGNVPFGQFKVLDKRYDRLNFPIHEYYFAKTLDKVRPGGVVAFITSSFTMDKRTPTARKYIAQRTELLGAIRLPSNTFKANAGTEVTSDILFLQKRERMSDIDPEWVHLATDENGIQMNSYFIDHPDMILGEMKMVSGPFGPEPSCTAYEGKNLEDLLANAVQNIRGSITEYERGDELDSEDKSIEADPSVRNFSYTIVDGKLYYRENSRMNPVEASKTAESRIRGLIGLRDCVRTLLEYQTEDYPDADIKAQQAELNTRYDRFIKEYGLISSRGNALAFSEDSAYFLLCSLELVNEDGELIRKADLFTKRTIRSHQPAEKVDTAVEALAVSIGEKARVDMDYMGQLTGKNEEQLFADLTGVVFLNPAYAENMNEKYLPADEYLSGNVRQKLASVREKAQNEPQYAANITALEQVQPVELTAAEISVRLGATWLNPDYYRQFIFETLGTPRSAQWNIKVHYSNITGEWRVEGKNQDRGNVKAFNTYGTKRINAYEIIEDSLNLKDVRIFDYVYEADGKKTAVLNKKETAIAQSKQELLKEQFSEWIWKDPERREVLCKAYNILFNSNRPREYDGSHITFSGMNPEIMLRKHQVNAIAHIMYGGNTLLAHVVGAGKTFEMVAAAMESKRLGLCQKSLFVVPNHLTEQWATEFLQLYPAANVLVATKKDFEAQNRKKFCGRIATGEYDAVIVGHSQFEKIPMSVERQRAILEQQRDEILMGISEAKRDKAENFTIKQMEKTRKGIEARIDKLNDQSRKDDVVTFEELGCDRLFIDESHFFKNLFLYTKMRNVGGIAQTEAQKSSDLFMKCRYLDELTGGRGIVFATGTAISI